MEYCAWLDSQSEAARRHANKEDTRYHALVLPAVNTKPETTDSITSRPVLPKTAKVVLDDTDAVVVAGTPSF
jgi:hypothetical protein